MDENEQLFTHQERHQVYLEEQKTFGEFLEKNTFAGKVLKENGYQIFDVHQAQEDFRKVMGLDGITEIAGTYTTTKFENDMPIKTKHTKKITKSNFWNAFYEPIWKNLTVSEKIRSLEWMFERINQKYDLGIKRINYIIDNQMIDAVILENDWKNLKGAYNNKQNLLFLNLDFLLKSEISYFSVPLTLVHELMHARQHKYIKDFDFNRPKDFYTLSQTDRAKIPTLDLRFLYHLDYSTVYALYRTSKSEKAAELMGLKTINKILKLNQKDFEPNELIDRSINSTYKIIKNGILFGNLEIEKIENKKKIKPTEGIVLNEKAVLRGQSENLLKLVILKNYYEDKLDVIEQLNEQEISSKIKKQISSYKKKLRMIKSTFMSTLKKGHLPEKFNAKKEFAVLNLIEEPEKVYSLPRWLQKDEDEKREHIESEKKKFEKSLKYKKNNEQTK